MVAMRRATIADAEAIAKIHVEAYEASLADVTSREVLDEANAGRLAMWKSLLVHPPDGQAVFVVVDDDVTGFVSAGPTRDRGAPSKDGEVDALFVHPARWRSGIGSALLARSLEHLEASGLERAKLWVLDKNDRARRFYEARGWCDTGALREDERGRFLRYATSV